MREIGCCSPSSLVVPTLAHSSVKTEHSHASHTQPRPIRAVFCIDIIRYAKQTHDLVYILICAQHLCISECCSRVSACTQQTRGTHRYRPLVDSRRAFRRKPGRTHFRYQRGMQRLPHCVYSCVYELSCCVEIGPSRFVRVASNHRNRRYFVSAVRYFFLFLLLGGQ